MIRRYVLAQCFCLMTCKQLRAASSTLLLLYIGMSTLSIHILKMILHKLFDLILLLSFIIFQIDKYVCMSLGKYRGHDFDNCIKNCFEYFQRFGCCSIKGNTT